ERDDLTPGLRTMVFRLHEKRLPHALGTIYERANAALEDAGFGGMGASAKPRYGGSVIVQAPAAGGAGGAVAGGTVATGADGLWMPDGGVVEHVHGPQHAGVAGLPMAMPGGTVQAAAPAAAGVGTVPASSLAAMGGAATAADFAGRAPRYRDVVREQLQTWRERQTEASEQAARQADEHAAADAASHVLGTEDLLNVARMLQGDDPAPFVRALSGKDGYALAGALREETLDGIRQLSFDPDETALSSDEQDAIDLVGILFQSLVEANELMQRARDMYGRLVVPYLKVA